MPDRFLNLISDLTITILGFFWFITWSSLVAAVPTLFAMLYWIPKIKYSVVNKYHGGSWWKWFKSFVKKN